MRYSERAKRAFAFLFRPYNDIDVYVEDTANRNMYEVLINRMLKGRARVTRVFQLGGADKVVAECTRAQGNTTRRCLYIIDGDLDLLLGRPAPPLHHLYRLAVYSSENLVIAEHGLVEVGFESDPQTDRVQIARRLDWPNTVEHWARQLVPLFILYAACFEARLPDRTSGRSVMELCVDVGSGPELDPGKVERLREELRMSLERSFSEDEIAIAIERIRGGAADVAMLRYVSGKTYLLPLAYHWLRRHTGFRGTLEQLKVRLARYADIDVDPGLLDAVNAAAQA